MDAQKDSQTAAQGEMRRSSLDQQYASLHAMKRDKPANADLKASIQEQYAPKGMIGQAWNKFARGVGMEGPK